MEIFVGEDYKITSDVHNLILNERVISKKGEKYYRAISYHTTLPDLARAMLERSIRKSDAESILKLSEAVNRIKKEIMTAVPDIKTEYYRQKEA